MHTHLDSDQRGFIKLWDLNIRRSVSTMDGHTEKGVLSLETSFDRRQLLSYVYMNLNNKAYPSQVADVRTFDTGKVETEYCHCGIWIVVGIFSFARVSMSAHFLSAGRSGCREGTRLLRRATNKAKWVHKLLFAKYCESLKSVSCRCYS